MQKIGLIQSAYGMIAAYLLFEELCYVGGLDAESMTQKVISWFLNEEHPGVSKVIAMLMMLYGTLSCLLLYQQKLREKQWKQLWEQKQRHRGSQDVFAQRVCSGKHRSIGLSKQTWVTLWCGMKLWILTTDSWLI